MSDTAGTAATGGYAEASGDDFTVTSNTESAQDMQVVVDEDAKEQKEALGEDGDEEGDVSKAAAALGKKGGQAAAKARKEADKAADKAETPKEAKPKETKPEEADAEKDKIGNPRNDARARVEQATRQAAEARRAAFEERERSRQLEERLAKLEADRQRGAAQPGQAEGRPAPAQSFPDDPRDPRPQEEDFENYAEFVEARARWASRKEYSQLEQKRQAEHHARQVFEDMCQRGDSAKQIMDKAREAVPDLEQRTDPRLWQLSPSWTLPPGTRPQASNLIADGLLSAKEGDPTTFASMMLHLTEHPEVVAKLLRMPPITLLQAMARLEAEVSPNQSNSAPRQAVSKAKPPIRPVQGTASVPDDGSDDESFDAHMARENAAEERRRRSR